MSRDGRNSTRDVERNGEKGDVEGGKKPLLANVGRERLAFMQEKKDFALLMMDWFQREGK